MKFSGFLYGQIGSRIAHGEEQQDGRAGRAEKTAAAHSYAELVHASAR